MASNSKIGQKKQARGRVASATADREFTRETVESVSTKVVKPSLQAGQFIRWTITVRPDQLDRVKQIAATLVAEIAEAEGREVDVALLTLARWLLDAGMNAFDAGERPQIESRIRLK